MNPQQGIMSLAKPDAQADRAVGQVLSSTTQMLGKLDNKTLGLLLQLTQYLKAHKSKYKELMANLEAKGSLPPGVFPDHYDPKFLSVFAMSVAKAQQAKGGMAAGGIASIAQTMKDQGRGKDTMLAHISPSEAKLLEKRGGVNTINPVTGLPEFGIFEDIGNALSGVGNAVGSVLKPVGDLIGSVVSSPLGLAATAAAAYYFMGPGAAVVPSVAEAAIPGEAAAIGTAAHLTPAAIESGIGSAGYGTNASAAASGLFNPETIGSGAAIGAPSTSEKLLTANLLKNTRLSAGKEDSGSDPNALIKMLMMFEMMNNKQSQPGNAVVPALVENTSNLPYDTPKKQLSSFIQPTSQTPQRAAEGGLMTKHLGIGGLSANRTQTDYAKNYLPGSKYRPGQGGITYFTPMRYGPNVPAPSLPVEPTPTPVDELVKQTIGKPGGGGRGEREPEDPNSFSAQWAAMTDAEKEAYRLEHPMLAAAQDLAMLIGAPFMWAYNKIQEAMGPDSSTGGPSRYKSTVTQAAPTGTETPYSPSELVGAAMRDIEGINPANFNDAPVSAAEREASQRTVDSLGKSARAAEFGGQTTGFTDGSYTTSLSLPSYQAGDESKLARDISDGTVKSGDSVSFAGQQYKVNVNDGSINLTKGTQEGPATFSLPAAAAQTNAAITNYSPSELAGIAALNAAPVDAFDFGPTAGALEAEKARQTEEQKARIESLLGVDPYAKFDQLNFDQTAPAARAELAAQTEAQKARIQSLAADLGYSPMVDPYSKTVIDPQKYVDSLNKQIDEKEKFAELAIQANEPTSEQTANEFQNEAAQLRTERENFLAGSVGDQYKALANEQSAANLMGGDVETFAPQETAPVDSEKERLDQIIQSFLDSTSVDNSIYGPAVQLAALGDYNLGEDGTAAGTIGNYSMLAPQQPADTSGLLSTAAVQQAFPGAFDQSPLSSLAPTPSYTGGQNLGSIANSYGNEGSVWTNGEGKPWVGADGKFILTSQGAAQNAFNESPAGQEAAMRAEVQSLQNRYPAPSSETQDPAQRQGQGGQPPGNGDNQGGGDSQGGGLSNQSSDTRAALRSNEGYGGGSSDARGGYLQNGKFDQRMAHGGIAALSPYNLGSYSDGGRLLKGPGDGVSDDIPATIGQGQPARLADGEFVIPARIVSELGNGSTDAGAKRLYEMMDRIQKVRRKTKNVAANTKAAKYLPA